MRVRTDRSRGRKPVSIRGNDPQTGCGFDGGDREYRHRRAIDDSQRREKLRIRHSSRRSGGLRHGAGKYAGEQRGNDAEIARATRHQSIHKDVGVRSDDQ